MTDRPLKQERAQRTRAALVQAAAEVFAESGFAGASVTKIANRAGLTLGAMYFHFENKEAVAREIVRAQPTLATPPNDSEGLQRAIDLTLTWAYGVMDDPLLMAGARLVMEQDAFIDPQENTHRQWTALIAEALSKAAKKRETRAGVDAEVVARLLVNACTGAQMHAYMESGPDRGDLPERVEEMWRCLLPAIAVPSAVKRLGFGEERARA
ncbi:MULTISPECIES: ScbR family autoregulator-binding transcription factor [unclassified Streptomyces]|uniref:ScbR family autoregulator-binding transcription factor n=1 Tax=unclassified Streptomyces TaxID=2593676 RepID=UPI0038226BC8